MRSSRFCLHPAGDTPSSCRLFDAIASHCVPVIVSDRLELPFEDEIDYREFSLFFSIQEAIRPDYLVNYLRNIEEGHWLRMWNRLKEVSHHFQYQHPPKRDDAVNMIWKQVQHKVPAVKLAMHRNQRLKIADWWQRWWHTKSSMWETWMRVCSYLGIIYWPHVMVFCEFYWGSNGDFSWSFNQEKLESGQLNDFLCIGFVLSSHLGYLSWMLEWLHCQGFGSWSGRGWAYKEHSLHFLCPVPMLYLHMDAKLQVWRTNEENCLIISKNLDCGDWPKRRLIWCWLLSFYRCWRCCRLVSFIVYV